MHVHSSVLVYTRTDPSVLSLPSCRLQCMVLDFLCCVPSVPSVHGVSCVCTVPDLLSIPSSNVHQFLCS